MGVPLVCSPDTNSPFAGTQQHRTRSNCNHSSEPSTGLLHARRVSPNFPLSPSRLIHSEMRRRLTLLLLFLSLLAGFSGISVYTFFHRIFGPHSGIALTQKEVLQRYGDAQPGDEKIPRIIHQIYHNWNLSSPASETLPEDWERVSSSCRVLNSGWEYKVRLYRPHTEESDLNS